MIVIREKVLPLIKIRTLKPHRDEITKEIKPEFDASFKTCSNIGIR